MRRLFRRNGKDRGCHRVLVAIVPGGTVARGEAARPASPGCFLKGRDLLERLASWGVRRRHMENNQIILRPRHKGVRKTYPRKSLLVLLKPLERPVRYGQE